MSQCTESVGAGKPEECIFCVEEKTVMFELHLKDIFWQCCIIKCLLAVKCTIENTQFFWTSVSCKHSNKIKSHKCILSLG